MKVLLDENLPHRLRNALGAHEAFTVRYMGWAGLKNGALLSVAEESGFEVFITGDQTLSYEQNLTGRRIAVLVLSTIDRDTPQTQRAPDRCRVGQRNARNASASRLRHV